MKGNPDYSPIGVQEEVKEFSQGVSSSNFKALAGIYLIIRTLSLLEEEYFY